MKNGQLKPGYNIQIGTENGFVLGYDVFPNPTDTRTLIPFLENTKRRLNVLPKKVIADAGYGSQENYEYLESYNIDPIVKYATFHKEASRSWKKDPYRTENLAYDLITDTYICPVGKKLVHTHDEITKTTGGYRQELRIYTCEGCIDCPQKSLCTKAKGNRSIQRNERMLRYRKQAQDRLLSIDGKALRKRRAVEVETVFGEIKGNRGYRRFLLRGKQKVATEWGLLMMGYNLRRLLLAR